MLRTEYFLCSISNLFFYSYLCISRVRILIFFLSSDDSAEFNLVNNALLSIFKMDAKGKGHIFRYMAFINTSQSLVGWE